MHEVADDLPLLMEVNEEIIEEVYDLEVDDIDGLRDILEK